MRPKAVGLVGFDQATASHLTGPADALGAATLEDGFGGVIPCYRIWMIGLTNKPFTCEAGMVFQPEATLTTAPSLDTIIVAGGSGLRRPRIYHQLVEWILGRSHETRRIASICTGIRVLAPTGLLDGREVTTHWRLARELRERHPGLRIDHKRRLVKDGPFYTSAGLTAGIDLALALIEEDYGRQLALSVGRNLMMYLAPTAWPDEEMRPRDWASRPIDRFGELIGWIMRNLNQNLTVEVLARQACMCPSHFTRAFKSVFGSTPGEFVENLRLNEARRRLSSRDKTLDSVATSVGFANATTFRRAFARRFGAGPGACLDRGTIPVSPSPRLKVLAQN